MTRRVVYDAIGGFANEMGGFADIDYCLRVAGAGYRVVFTPHAALVDDKSSSTVSDADADEAARFRTRWSDRLAQDPYYNRNFSRDTPDYEPDLTASAAPEL